MWSIPKAAKHLILAEPVAASLNSERARGHLAQRPDRRPYLFFLRKIKKIKESNGRRRSGGAGADAHMAVHVCQYKTGRERFDTGVCEGADCGAHFRWPVGVALQGGEVPTNPSRRIRTLVGVAMWTARTSELSQS